MTYYIWPLFLWKSILFHRPMQAKPKSQMMPSFLSHCICACTFVNVWPLLLNLHLPVPAYLLFLKRLARMSWTQKRKSRVPCPGLKESNKNTATLFRLCYFQESKQARNTYHSPLFPPPVQQPQLCQSPKWELESRKQIVVGQYVHWSSKHRVKQLCRHCAGETGIGQPHQVTASPSLLLNATGIMKNFNFLH